MNDEKLKELYREGLDKEYARLSERLNDADLVVLYIVGKGTNAQCGFAALRDELGKLIGNGYIALDHVLRLRAVGLVDIVFKEVNRPKPESYVDYFDEVTYDIRLTEFGKQMFARFEQEHDYDDEW